MSAQAARPTTLVFAAAPTDTKVTSLRGAAGVILANRTKNARHTGVDIVANQSQGDKESYRIMAVADGTVAYAATNGIAGEGFGYTVVIDHGEGIYSQYSHMAAKASSGIVSVGVHVKAGDTIGFMADTWT
jgi:murein DD-endopeptidase MepM/ murein hydrolase activator NlpD